MAHRPGVLIVDDAPEFTEALSRALTDAGYHVARAGTFAEAQACLQRRRFDVAVVDLNLAGENGIELIRQIRMERPQIQILGITGVESDLYLRIAQWVGADVCGRKFPELPDGGFPAGDWARAIAAALSGGERAAAAGTTPPEPAGEQ